MKIAVIGASGNAGSRITAELARRGHAVTAIARHPEKIAAQANVTPTKGDVMDQAGLARLLAGHDAAVSSVHFLASDPLKLIGAARDSKVTRYLVVGGAGSLEVAPGVQLVDTPTFPAPYKPYALAHREALGLLRAATDLDWTFYAPAAEIGPGEAVGAFRTGAAALIVGSDGHSRISYPDYAQAFVDEIEAPRFAKQIATVAY